MNIIYISEDEKCVVSAEDESFCFPHSLHDKSPSAVFALLISFSLEPRFNFKKVIEPICYSLAPHPRSRERKPSTPIRYSSQSNIRKTRNLKGVNDLIRRLSTEYTKNLTANPKTKASNTQNEHHTPLNQPNRRNLNKVSKAVSGLPHKTYSKGFHPELVNGVALNRVLVGQKKLQPIKANCKIDSPTFADAMVNGTRIVTASDYPDKYLSITEEIKKKIIVTMLKESKLPLDLVSPRSYPKAKNEVEMLEKMSEAILSDYDVVVQVVNENAKDETTPKKASREESSKKTELPNCVTVKATTCINSTVNKRVSTSPLKKLFKPDISNVKVKQDNDGGKSSGIRRLPAGVRKCAINEIIALINKYTSLTFRNKDSRYNLKAINDLHPVLNLGKRFQLEEEVKSRERISQAKEKLLRLLYLTLNRENDYIPETCSRAPRFSIGRGNNSRLVKSLMRERWWWISAEDVQRPYNLLWTQWRNIEFIGMLGTRDERVQGEMPRVSNHLEGNYYLGHKKNMYKCLLTYYALIGKEIAEVVPLTFHIKYGKTDLEFGKFRELYLNYKKQAQDDDNEFKNVWIIKPGENSNRGNGIVISNNLAEITKIVEDTSRTHIIQKYIERPLLFESRKFDIRCFALLTSINGHLKAFYYQEGYLRTSSKDYTVHSLSKAVHLTNEAVQAKYQGFGKHEAGNKISYADFQKYLEVHPFPNGKPPAFHKTILPKIKVLVVRYN